MNDALESKRQATALLTTVALALTIDVTFGPPDIFRALLALLKMAYGYW
jgi:hypothetical protein